MAWAKRVLLFVTVNILILITISIIFSVFGFQPYLSARGINYASLMIFSLVWGMGGAFISLGMSRVMAKWMMGVKVIPPDVRDPQLIELVQTVHNLATAAGLPKMPQVGVYQSPELNAFATGPTRSRALVAVSTGLLQRMDRQQVEGVLGHEITHVANGDMVTMTLLQGVINAFVIFLARVIAFFVAQFLRERDERGPSFLVQYLIIIVLEIVLSILGAIVVAAFSRWREFRADAGGARLAGRGNMISALRALQAATQVDPRGEALATLKISNRNRRGLRMMFATHPRLEERIARLERAA
jgi:heat shock protein HtpX